MTKAEEFLKHSGAFPLNYLNVLWNPNYERDSFDLEKFHAHYQIRDKYIAKFGFAIPNAEAIEMIRNYQPLLEVGAGSGYWSYELWQAKIDIIATDPGIGQYRHRENGLRSSGGWPDKFTTVQKLTARRAIEKYPNRNLLTVWPDYNSPWTTGMLRAFKAEYVIYVGEGPGGCTGSEKFHEILEAEYEDIADVHIPQFDGIHDRLFVFRKRRKEV